jgi:hypothetical protein
MEEISPTCPDPRAKLTQPPGQFNARTLGLTILVVASCLKILEVEKHVDGQKQ